MVAEEGGVTVHSAFGVELGGYIPRGDYECDHCGTFRNRTRMYLVRDNRDGSIVQLGSNCIEAYTGIEPKGLWLLALTDDLNMFSHGGNGGGHQEYLFDVNTVLAYALAHSAHGRRYVSTSSEDSEPTVEKVRTSLYSRKIVDSDRFYYTRISDEAAAIVHDAELMADLRAAVDTLDIDTDYGRNMAVIVNGKTVTPRNVGILTSLVAVYARMKRNRERAAQAPAAKGFIAEVGERVHDIDIKLNVVKVSTNAYGFSTFLVGTVEDGRVVVWKASKFLNVESGDVLHISAATVKEHGSFNGSDQTVITRAKVA